MSINVLNRKLLWGRAGNRCAFPACSQTLTADLGTEDSELLATVGVVMGEEAHIRSARPDGPRYDAEYADSKLDSYENLLLLCPTHHTLIDKNSGAGFSVVKLEEMKASHERLVTESLGAGEKSQRELSERMAALLLVWEQKMELDQWESVTGLLNQPIPILDDASYSQMTQAGAWLLKMRWPSRFPRTELAFRNLRHVMGDLLNHLQNCMESENEYVWRLRRDYKNISWDPDAYKTLFAEFQVERFYLYVLVIEATKAINWVIAEAASEVDVFYRFDQGLILMRDGDGVFKTWMLRLEYESGELDGETPAPHPGKDAIVEFLKGHISRDAHYFEGYNLAALVREIETVL
ncbi:HNH endonuclease signature motif containing protein [Streptomyces fradiae]|uniref:HNH endonuclease signature motif containing protein n=1 Tax=Streptomyces fradiae TaxID=1906 RepID=UPI002943DA39|nr:HNH endonuclease signature motif containing protein [Streptomyces fradiae]WOI58944.1 HNH endonuclease signature motif containing protein [Streptomyces fradiae]